MFSDPLSGFLEIRDGSGVMAPDRRAHGRPCCAGARADVTAPRAHQSSDLGAVKPWRAVQMCLIGATLGDFRVSRRSWLGAAKQSRRAAHAGGRARAGVTASRDRHSSDHGAVKPWRAVQTCLLGATPGDFRVSWRSWLGPGKLSRRAGLAAHAARAGVTASRDRHSSDHGAVKPWRAVQMC